MNLKKIWLLLETILKNRSLFGIESELKKSIAKENNIQAGKKVKYNGRIKESQSNYNNASNGVKIGERYDFQKYTKQPYQGLMINFGQLGSMIHLLNNELEVVSPGYHSINLVTCTAKTGAAESVFNYHLTSLN